MRPGWVTRAHLMVLWMGRTVFLGDNIFSKSFGPPAGPWASSTVWLQGGPLWGPPNGPTKWATVRSIGKYKPNVMAHSKAQCPDPLWGPNLSPLHGRQFGRLCNPTCWFTRGPMSYPTRRSNLLALHLARRIEPVQRRVRPDSLAHRRTTVMLPAPYPSWWQPARASKQSSSTGLDPPPSTLDMGPNVLD